jgi:TolB-like protein/DNA-binding winged helix-turn-helix (wHTH) protein/tetratricopeptide (TPR) repeat protein
VAHRYTFDDVQIDLQSFRLLKDGKVVPVEPKALNLLIFLVENRGRLVERRELIDAVWGDAFVTDHVLNYSIGQLRKGLVDDAKKPRYIETVPTRGYRFIAAVEAEELETAAAAPIPTELEHVPQPALNRQQPAESGAGKVDGIAPVFLGRLPSRAVPIVGFALLIVVVGVVSFWVEGRGSHASSSIPIRSLAVLPLENLSGDTSQEYLADGMTDELITGLGQISALQVISRTTAMQYKNAHKSLPQIAKELNVDAVVEGSVVRSGERIRIAAQLIEAPADRQIWARSFEGDMQDVLGLQNQVAGAVAEQIRIKLTVKEQTELADTRQVDPQAYEAFLKGHFFEQNTPETLRKSIQFYKQAVQLDPSFARAYVGIARSTNYLSNWGTIPRGEAAATSDAEIAKALELEPDLGEAYTERGWTRLLFHWDFPGAERDFQHALELDPGSSDTHSGLSAYDSIMGRSDESLQEIRRAMQLDPLSLEVNTDYCRSLEAARRYDDAVAQCKAALELDPNFKYALYYLGEYYERKRDYPEAHKIWERYGGCDASCIAMEDEIHGAPGVAGAFDAWLKAQKKQPDAFFLAQAYAGLGRKDQAFAWLEKAYEQRSGGEDLTFLPVNSGFDPLRSDPRFDAFLRRVGLPPQPHFGLTQIKLE